MGNKMCASFQKGYNTGAGTMFQPWPARKHLHLIRLWAEIFEVREEGGRLVWSRVWDEIVPVNVICIQDSPVTVYQITAYDQLVKKVFDVQLCQPGTMIVQTSECFLHWNDPLTGREWGLNFTRPADARQFFECCTMRVVNGLSRKASSSESLRPKSQKRTGGGSGGGGAKTSSNHSSPTSHPHHCAMSTSVDSSSDARHSANGSASSASQQLQALSASVDQWCHNNVEQMSTSSHESSCRHGRQQQPQQDHQQQHLQPQQQSSRHSSCSSKRRSCSNLLSASSEQTCGPPEAAVSPEPSKADASTADINLASTKTEPSSPRICASPVAENSDHGPENTVEQCSTVEEEHYSTFDEQCTTVVEQCSTVEEATGKAVGDSRKVIECCGDDLGHRGSPDHEPSSDNALCDQSQSTLTFDESDAAPLSSTVALSLFDDANRNHANGIDAAEGYTSESSSTALRCAYEDIYDVVESGDDGVSTRFVESQEKIRKFFDDFGGHIEASPKIHRRPDVAISAARRHSPDGNMGASGGKDDVNTGSLCSDLGWESGHTTGALYCSDLDVLGASSSQLLDMVDWPPPPRWENDDEDCDTDDDLISSTVEVVTESKAESEFDSLALQRLLDSIPTPFRTPSSSSTALATSNEQVTQADEAFAPTLGQQTVADQPLPAADDVEVDSVLDGGSGSPDDSVTNGEHLQVAVSSFRAAEEHFRSVVETPTSGITPKAAVDDVIIPLDTTASCSDSACKISKTISSGQSQDESRSRQALTVSVISADSGCSSQSDAAADSVSRSAKQAQTAADQPVSSQQNGTSSNVGQWSDVVIRSHRRPLPYEDQRSVYYAERSVYSPSTSQQRLSTPTFSSFTGRPAPPSGAISQPSSAPVLPTNTTEIPDLLRTRSSTQATNPRVSPQRPVPTTCRHQIADNSFYAPLPPLANSHRIGKVVLELLDTERQYVRDLISLIYRYLEPLRSKAFVSRDAVEQLLGNISKIVHFHAVFLHSLENVFERTALEFGSADDILKDEVLRRILTLIASLFVCNVQNFKLYSMFCACHSKAQKIILSDGNTALQDFLRSCNPRQQHSVTLESYLIKPIQRILKYPLLLGQLVELTEPRTEEHQYLTEALGGMQAVAEHMNEMQKIYDEFGSTFDEMSRDSRLVTGKHRVAINLNVCELQMYGTVRWLNASDALGKLKKSSEVLTVVFIFKSAIAIIAQEQIKAKKKSKLLSVGQSGKSAAAAVAAGAAAAGNERGSAASATFGARFQIAMPVDQIQVRTVVGEQCQRHAIWEIAYCRLDNDGKPRKMVYQFLSSYKARNDFIRAIHHMIHDSVCHAGYPTTTSLAGLQVVTPILQQPRCAAAGPRYAQHPAPPGGGQIYGELHHASVSPSVARCGHQGAQPSDAAATTSNNSARRRSIGSSSGAAESVSSARDTTLSHYGTVPHNYHANASAAAYQLYGLVPPARAPPAREYATQQRLARHQSCSGDRSSSKKPSRKE